MKDAIQFQKPNYQIRSLTFSPNGQFLATIGENADKYQTVVLWETASSRELAQLDANIEPPGILQVLFSPDSQIVLTVQGFLGQVTLWKMPSGEKLKELSIGNLVAISPNSQILAATHFPIYEPEDFESRHSTIGLYSLTGESLGHLEGNEHYIYDLQISPDGQYLAAIDHPRGEESGTLRLWNLSPFSSFN
ncbi:MAG: hypothetical protein IM550_09035 [Microcystis sp. M54BS1]|jgi:WD40 repeat protein|uniref:Protein TolB n=2 Tax=Microcystis aeruginosa TaxID=1126 RepID=A0A5A5RTK1_MICAE|nr:MULTISPECIES: hypothetical protein [Microcystis]MBE5232004.1 hypothetical protein [Microcystis aeruginosa PMC 728.11]MCA2539366.1 hypothetical protein [Microcystis sp. M54BS1]MCA2593663.1 hypothetical protein [Microcystis sp. M38BS1]MCA2610554.1 hypothetical protein [Microcystis sp. M27BS1]NCQ89910.1 hypothetical protein [Microcystis aeruginosa LG13-13]NCR03222.1 hypothetical protein [Microcystis aeruginosa LG13-03]NCR61249.1 hypothetical protein [Microcystis aeruginosa LG11-05]NCR75477.